MKKIGIATLLLPLLVSCGLPPTISKDEALKHVTVFASKYSDYKNVENNYVYLKTNKDKDGKIVLAEQCAFDYKNKKLYYYVNSGIEMTSKYNYFDVIDGKTYFWELVNDKAGKNKYKTLVDSSVDQELFFKSIFADHINSQIENLTIQINKAGDNATYRSSKKNDLIFDYQGERNKYYTDMRNNQLLKIDNISYDDNKKVLLEEIIEYSYEIFVVTVNPDEYKEKTN